MPFAVRDEKDTEVFRLDERALQKVVDQFIGSF